MTKTTITQTDTGTVALSYDDAKTGERITREFTVVGSDVREYDSRGNLHTVCSGLSSGGWVLSVGKDGLLSTIRREYRAMRRAEAKFWATR